MTVAGGDPVGAFMMYWQPETANQMASLQHQRPRDSSYHSPDANWKCPCAGYREQRVGGKSITASVHTLQSFISAKKRQKGSVFKYGFTGGGGGGSSY